MLLAVASTLAPLGANAQTPNFALQDMFRYDEPSHKTFIDGVGEETVDPFSGNLHIVQTDLVLPGKAGLDLRLTRSYSSKLWMRTDTTSPGFLGNNEPPMIGWGWSFHMGRLRYPSASGFTASSCSGGFPVVELPDGTSRVFYRANASASYFVSKDRWRMEPDCSVLGGAGTGTCVWSPDGVRWEFASTNTIHYGDASIGYPLSQIVDRFGNAIQVRYLPDYDGSISQITDTYGRVIYFAYTGTGVWKRLDTVTAGTHVFQYGYLLPTNLTDGRPLLASVTPPDGPPFQYVYGMTGSAQTNVYALTSLQYPYGGKVSYTYATATFWPGTGAGIPFPVLQTRTISGPGLDGGTWTYAYVSGSTGMNTTTVLRPDGRGGTTSDVYTMYGFGAVSAGDIWRVGLTQQVSRANGAETETYTWQPSGTAVSTSSYTASVLTCTGYLSRLDTAVYEPWLAQRTIVRDTGTFTTVYSNWDSYGQPQTVTETGPAGNGGTKTRTTTLAYFSAPTDGATSTLNMLKGFVLSQRSCVSTDCVTQSATYTGPRYAKDSETRGGVKTTYSYHQSDPEGFGNLKSITNPLNQGVTYSDYSGGYGTPLGIDLIGAYTFTRTATREGWVLSLTDGRQKVTGYKYDGIGRLKRTTPPGSNDETTYVYDQPTTNGVNVVVTRGAYVVTTTYDGFGRAVATSDSLGVRTSTRYDVLGRKWFHSYPFASTEVGEKVDYDLLDRATRLTKGCTGVTTPTATCAGNDRSAVDYVYAAGNCVTTNEQRVPDTLSTKRCYDAFGEPGEAQLTYLKDAAGSTWLYAYATAGGLKSVTAPVASGSRSYTFDSTQFGFVTGEQAPELGTISGDTVSVRYAPNSLGQVKTRKDARGVTWTYDYTDPLSRLRSISYSTGNADNVSQSYETGSNNVRQLSTTNGGTYDYTLWDELNRLRSQTWTFGGQPYSTTYSYDSHGCLTSVRYPTGSLVEQSCDSAGRVTSVKLNGTSIVTGVTYHASGQPSGVTFATGPSTALTYDDRARLKTLTTSGVLDLSYTYDGLDNVTTFNNAVAPGSALRMCSTASGTCISGYDALNRLITVIAPGRWGTAVYDYDALGNRKLKSEDQPSASTEVYTYSSANRLDTASGPETFRPMTFTWDAASRLASSSDGTTYKYDGAGRRVQKVEPSGTTVYHYDVVGRVIAETTPAGLRLRDYVYLGNRLIAVEGCISDGATPPCNERQRYHTDALGSVLARTDASGAVVARLEYQPFGEQWQPAGAQGDRQYNGRVFDPGTGFHDYGARMYWPQIGRFVSADSYAGDVASPASLNRYSYVLNNPYRYTDPTGHQEAEEVPSTLSPMGAGAPPIPASTSKQSGSGSGAGVGAPRASSPVVEPLPLVEPSPSVVSGEIPAPSVSSEPYGPPEAPAAEPAPASTLKPGPYAKQGVPARGPGRDFTRGERDAVNAEGRCHTCGSPDPKTKSGDFVPDHQPPNALNPPGAAQRLYPQCLNCARRQGGDVNAANARKP